MKISCSLLVIRIMIIIMRWGKNDEEMKQIKGMRSYDSKQLWLRFNCGKLFITLSQQQQIRIIIDSIVAKDNASQS